MARKLGKSIMVDKEEYKALLKFLKKEHISFNEWVRRSIRIATKQRLDAIQKSAAPKT